MQDHQVTFVIYHRVKPGCHGDYEQWLARVMPVAQAYPGHLGVNVIRPADGDRLYTVIIRFAGADYLRGWVESEDRRRFIDEVAALLLEEGERTENRDGGEFWFTPAAPGRKHPVRWKQFLMTFSVILPLTMAVPRLWQPLFQIWPWLAGYLASHAVVAASIVFIVVYGVMPYYTRIAANWLYR